MFELVGQQFLLGRVLQPAHLLDEQLGCIIQCLGMLGANEDGGQRIALVRSQFG